MNRIILFALTTVMLNEASAQDTIIISRIRHVDSERIVHTDTVAYDVFDYPVLYGTTALPSSGGQVQARNYGWSLLDAVVTPCAGEGRPDEFPEGVTDINQKDNTWKVECRIVDNCCYEFLCDMQVIDGHILNLNTIGYGASDCACTCCFGVQFTLEHWMDFTEDGRSITHLMINGEAGTLTALTSN